MESFKDRQLLEFLRKLNKNSESAFTIDSIVMEAEEFSESGISDMKNLIQKSADRLCSENLLKRTGNIYRVVSDTEMKIDREIRSQVVTEEEVSEYILDVIVRRLVSGITVSLKDEENFNISVDDVCMFPERKSGELVFLSENTDNALKKTIPLRSLSKEKGMVVLLDDNGYYQSVMEVLKARRFFESSKEAEFPDEFLKIKKKYTDQMEKEALFSEREIEQAVYSGVFFVDGYRAEIRENTAAEKLEKGLRSLYGLEEGPLNRLTTRGKTVKADVKMFASFAGKELLEKVMEKAFEAGISEECIREPAVELTDEQMKKRELLISAINRKGYSQVMEETAYTWFNRFSAIQFMKVNGYLDNSEDPFDFSDGKDEDHRKRLINLCNSLAEMLPELFKDADDYRELLFPDNLASPESVISRMISGIDENKWKDSVEINGWLYQYYNTDKKDEIFRNLKKNIKVRKENLATATQIFTPEWIVKFLAENSLGRLWLRVLDRRVSEGTESRQAVSLKKKKLISRWEYYLETPGEGETSADIKSPEDIRIIDPACGSGHMLSYVFDCLMEIYLSEGYEKEKAAELIVRKNIYGLEIDRRAAQLSYFTIMMKGRKYDEEFLKKGISPCVYKTDRMPEGEGFSPELENADEYGSCLKFDAHIKTVDDIIPEGKKEEYENKEEIRALRVLLGKYHVVITNPPYMALSNMSPELSSYVKRRYPDSKNDLFAVFMEKCAGMLKPGGYRAMITQHSWMFLSGFENLRKKVLKSEITVLAHLGSKGFDEIMGEVVQTAAFVTENVPHRKGFKGCYKRLVDGTTEEKKHRDFFKPETTYYMDQDNYRKIPGSPVAYWLGENAFNAFSGKLLRNRYECKKGMFTGDNDYFLKKWYEVPYEKTANEFKRYNKGGGYRRWYGCNDVVVRWHNDGEEIKKAKGSGNINESLFYKTCLSWNLVSTAPFCCRIIEKGAVMGDAGPICCIEEDDRNYYYLLGYLNSVVCNSFLKVLNPTMNFPTGVVGSLPVIFKRNSSFHIEEDVKECIRMSKEEWNSYETSMGYRENPLIKYIRSGEARDNSEDGSCLKGAYLMFKRDNNRRFYRMKEKEESINKAFIEIFHMENELSCEVKEKEVTVNYICDSREDLSEGFKGSRYILTERDVITDFISYITGCIFGRYRFYDESVIPVKKDNIIQINEEEDYYGNVSEPSGYVLKEDEKDLASMFINIIERLFGKENTECELEYIKKALGAADKKDARDVIRRYFFKDFYREHVKKYGKRPLYWQFDSGGKKAFRALIFFKNYDNRLLVNMRREYVHRKQAYFNDKIKALENVLPGLTRGKKKKAESEILKLREKSKELYIYEEKIRKKEEENPMPDFDMGVSENYRLFDSLLSKIR